MTLIELLLVVIVLFFGSILGYYSYLHFGPFYGITGFLMGGFIGYWLVKAILYATHLIYKKRADK
jgi:hypothetical protein